MDRFSLISNTTTDAMIFVFDADGRYGGSTTGPSKSVQFFLFYSGKISTQAKYQPDNPVRSSGGSWP
ncbi:hypothetical protein EB077_14260, partial [bacterium]|nr:hypothetical protein [bacterium]